MQNCDSNLIFIEVELRFSNLVFNTFHNDKYKLNGFADARQEPHKRSRQVVLGRRGATDSVQNRAPSSRTGKIKASMWGQFHSHL